MLIVSITWKCQVIKLRILGVEAQILDLIDTGLIIVDLFNQNMKLMILLNLTTPVAADSHPLYREYSYANFFVIGNPDLTITG